MFSISIPKSQWITVILQKLRITVIHCDFSKVTLCSLCKNMASHYHSDIFTVIPNITQSTSPSRRNCVVVWVCVCLSVTIEFLGVRKMFGGTYLVQFIRTKLLGVRKMFFVRVFARVMFSELRLYRKKSNHFPFFIFNTQSQSLHQNLHFHFHWKANPS
jgi:hypothetical protein